MTICKLFIPLANLPSVHITVMLIHPGAKSIKINSSWTFLNQPLLNTLRFQASSGSESFLIVYIYSYMTPLHMRAQPIALECAPQSSNTYACVCMCIYTEGVSRAIDGVSRAVDGDRSFYFYYFIYYSLQFYYYFFFFLEAPLGGLGKMSGV